MILAGVIIAACPAQAAAITPQAKAAKAEFLANVPAPRGGAGAVCVIDTGVTPLPGLDSQIVERISVVGGNGDDIRHTADNPFSGHGTFVASMIANRSTGIWPAANIVSVRAFHTAESGASTPDYVRAIFECLRRPGVQVITLALGAAAASREDLAYLEDRITNAFLGREVNVVASTGNDGALGADYPARFTAAFGIGATNASGTLCSFTNYGSDLNLSALGCDAHATGFDGSLGAFRGTSFAVPTAAAVLLALRAYRPDLSAGQAERLLATGPALDATAVFSAAGLNPVIEATDRVAAETVPQVRESKPSQPKATTVRFRRGVLTVQVSRPPRGGTAVFQVGKRTYTRANGKLRLRLRSWRRLTVFTQDAWGVRSDPLTLRR